MTDINIKNRILSILGFAVFSVVLTLQKAYPLLLVFFAFSGIVIFFADKILDGEKIKNKTATAFLVFFLSFQTFYQLFYREHETVRQILACAGTAVFLAAVFTLTDSRKMLYSIIAAPLLCVLNVQIAVYYSVILLSFSAVKLKMLTNVKDKKSKNKSKKKESLLSSKNLLFASLATGIAVFGICLYLNLTKTTRPPENISYLFSYFKNTLGFLILSVYLVIKLFKNKFNAKPVIAVGLLINLIATVCLTADSGWINFSLGWIALNIFLVLCCAESEEITDSVKKDFYNHKYLFFAAILLMLI